MHRRTEQPDRTPRLVIDGGVRTAAVDQRPLPARVVLITVGALFAVLSQASAFTATQLGRGGCAKLTTTIQNVGADGVPPGFLTYLQSYATDCSTPVVRKCENFPDHTPSELTAANDFVVRTHFMHQGPAGGPWTYCFTAGTDELPGAEVYCPGNQRLTTNAIQGDSAPVSDFGAFLGVFCGPGLYKAVAEGELRTPEEVIYLVAESNIVDPSDPNACICRDDGNACTDEVCIDGECRHLLAPRCWAPIFDLLAGGQCGDGVLDPGEACDDGNTKDRDCCSSNCRVEAAGSACAGGCEPRHCDGTGRCRAH